MVAFFQERGGEASAGAVAITVEGIEKDRERGGRNKPDMVTKGHVKKEKNQGDLLRQTAV